MQYNQLAALFPIIVLILISAGLTLYLGSRTGWCGLNKTEMMNNRKIKKRKLAKARAKKKEKELIKRRKEEENRAQKERNIEVKKRTG